MITVANNNIWLLVFYLIVSPILTPIEAKSQSGPNTCTDACPRPCYFGLCPLPPNEIEKDLSSARIATFGNWSVFDEYTFEGRNCWIVTASGPSRGIGHRVFLFYRLLVNQISIGTEGPSFSDFKTNQAKTGSYQFQFFFEDNFGWPPTSDDDQKIQKSLAQGNDLNILGQSGASLSFSAKGFLNSYAHAKEVCDSELED